MSRIRYIKPGFFENEELAECGALTRILYAGLWCWADREGRLEDRPRRLKAQILPYDDCDMESLMSELERGGFIQRYEVDGERYIAIPQFTHHQKPHRHEPASTIPAPPNSLPYTDIVGREPDKGGMDNGKVAQERGMGNGELVTENGERRTEKGVRGKSPGADAPVVVACPSDIDPRVFDVLDIFGEARSPDHVKYVAIKIAAHPSLNPVTAALETKEHISRSRKTYKKPLLTWSNWMKNEEKPPPWERVQPNGASSNGGPPIVDEPATPDDILEYIRSHSPHPEQWQS